MTDQQPIRKKVWDDPDLGEAFRGIARRFDLQPTFKLVELSVPYTEPMYLTLANNPLGIQCIRIRRTSAPEGSVLTGGMVDWVWDSTRAKITSIDGMSTFINTGVPFTFTFLAVFAPVLGS